MVRMLVAALVLGLLGIGLPRGADAQAVTVVCRANGWTPGSTFAIDYAARKVSDPGGKSAYAAQVFDQRRARWTWRDAEMPLVYGYTLDRASGRLDIAIYLPAGSTPPIERSVEQCRQS